MYLITDLKPIPMYFLQPNSEVGRGKSRSLMKGDVVLMVTGTCDVIGMNLIL
jgi:hypothetical protein